MTDPLTILIGALCVVWWIVAVWRMGVSIRQSREELRARKSGLFASPPYRRRTMTKRTSPYPDQISIVDVVFRDGEAKSYRMTASNWIVHHLMREAAQTGVLVFRDDISKTSICIPMAIVRTVEMRTVDPAEAIEK